MLHSLFITSHYSSMDIRQLQVFHTVMETRSVSRAARILGVSQPAVSTLIKRLEERLDIALFDRDRNRLEPTPEAVLLMQHVSQALESISKVRNAVHDIQHADTGVLTVAANPTSSISWLPPFVASFRTCHPAARIRLITRSSDVLREHAATYAADLMLSEPPVDPTSIEAKRYRLRCVAALPPGHPLCDQDVVTPENASPYPFIALSRWQATNFRVARAFDDSRQRWNVGVECELFSTALLLVAEGAGITVTEPIGAAAFAKAGEVVLRRFEPEIRYEMVLYHPSDRPLSLLGSQFIAEFSEYLEQYLER
jgi:DNA-binding transcriptional LysR family regulator